MTNDNIIILKSVYSRTPDQVYYIQPCKDPATKDYPDCVRDVDASGTLILSEQDKIDRSKGKVFIGKNEIIEVRHNTTFDLNIPVQRAQWEAIRHSSFIAEDRLARNNKGELLIEGEQPYVAENGVVLGKYGKADLYVYRRGEMAQSKNAASRLIFKAKSYVYNDSLDGWIQKAKLLEKDLSRANSNDVEEYMISQAEKYPEKIIDLYTGNTTAVRLLLVTAMDKKIIIKRDGLLIYADDIVLGASSDSAVKYLSDPGNVKVKEMIQRETFPDLYKKEAKTEDTTEDSGKKKK